MKTLTEIYQQLIDKKNRKKPYVVYEKSSISYHELLQAIHCITTLFSTYHLSGGSRIIICSNNDEAITLVTVAALLNGITSVILPADIKPNGANVLIEKSAPDLIIADNDKILSWQENNVPYFAIIEQKKTVKSSLLAKFKRIGKTRWFDSLKQFEASNPSLQVNPDDIAFINFTSGTTATPKGVQLSYKSLFSHLETLGKQFNYNEQSHILNNLVLSHVDGMIQGPMLALYFSASLYRPCSTDLQEIELYLNTIHREAITHLITVPTIIGFIDRFAQYNDYFDPPSFNHLISVAGMLNTDLWKRIEQRFNLNLCNIYGLTETVAGGIFCGPNHETYRQGTIGKPIDMELAIISPDGQKIENHKEGEIILKGDNVFSGYLDDTESTSAVMMGKWFRTGDLAYQDTEGFIHICGRIKELIVSGGLNIHPSEVNEALMRHHAVADVATFGQPHQDLQEIAMSAVVLKPDCEIDATEIINESRKWLENHKVPKKIVFVDKLPRGDSGKVRLPELQNILLSQEKNNNSLTFTLTQFFALISNELFVRVDQLSLSSRSEEIPGWDSLGHLNIVLAIEKAVNISLSAKEIMSITSLLDIWEIIENKTKNNA